MEIKKIIKILVIITLILIVVIAILQIFSSKEKEKKYKETTKNPNIAVQNNVNHSDKNNTSNKVIGNHKNNITNSNVVGNNTHSKNQVNNNQTNTQQNNVVENRIDDTEMLNNQEEERIREQNRKVELQGEKPIKTQQKVVFNTVQSCIKQYLLYAFNSNKTGVYNILDANYIQTHNITQDNVLNNIPSYEKNSINKAIEMYELAGSSFSIYQVKYQLGNEYIFFEVKLDVKTDSFSVEPINQKYYDAQIQTPSEGISKTSTITSNEYNHIRYVQ